MTCRTPPAGSQSSREYRQCPTRFSSSTRRRASDTTTRRSTSKDRPRPRLPTAGRKPPPNAWNNSSTSELPASQRGELKSPEDTSAHGHDECDASPPEGLFEPALLLPRLATEYARNCVVVGEASGGSAIAAKPAHGALEVCEKGEVAILSRQTIRCLSDILDEPVRVGVRNESILSASLDEHGHPVVPQIEPPGPHERHVVV